jgi:hypothetical protein
MSVKHQARDSKATNPARERRARERRGEEADWRWPYLDRACGGGVGEMGDSGGEWSYGAERTLCLWAAAISALEELFRDGPEESQMMGRLVGEGCSFP